MFAEKLSRLGYGRLGALILLKNVDTQVLLDQGKMQQPFRSPRKNPAILIVMEFCYEKANFDMARFFIAAKSKLRNRVGSATFPAV